MLRWFTACLVLLATPVLAGELSGKVIGISDGDTFTLLTPDKHQVKIRLAEIDAPENGQPYGNKSKQALSDLIFGEDLRVAEQAIDRYDRTVGRPYLGDLDICAEMVRIGAAWASGYLCQDSKSEADLITVVDLGNGSTEIVRGRWDGGDVVEFKSTSVSIGSSRLVARYNSDSRSYVRQLGHELSPVKENIQSAGIDRVAEGVLYVVGGVATKIGWLSIRSDVSERYRPDKVNGAVLELGELNELFKHMDRAYRSNPKYVMQIVDSRRGSEHEAARVLSGIPYLLGLVSNVYSGEKIRVSGYGVRHGMAFLLRHGVIES